MEHPNLVVWNVRIRAYHPVLGHRTTWIKAEQGALHDRDALNNRARLKLAYLNQRTGGGNLSAWTILNRQAFCPCPGYGETHYHAD